jgi:hypothetical protein
MALGDSEQKMFQSFRAAGLNQEFAPNCGTKYTSTIVIDAKHLGTLSMFVKNGKIAELEAIEGKYHTTLGISSDSTARDVQRHYRGLESYLYLLRTPTALYESPLVLWLGENQGIGFTLVQDRPRADSQYVVYSIIVFSAGSSPCVEDGTFPDPEAWQHLAPYTLGTQTYGPSHLR